VAKETSQRIGIEGASEIKQWLEATTRFAFTYTVYDNEAMCTRTCLNGRKKSFDLEGARVPTKSNPVATPVSVECKKLSQAGDQGPEFREFLAIAYSSTAHDLATLGPDSKREFMWVTFHPFLVTDWSDLLTVSHLRKWVEQHSELLNGEAINDDLLALVADRIWVMVVGQKQVDLRLSKDELAAVDYVLKKEGYRQ
jgi:hypothetical protein